MSLKFYCLALIAFVFSCTIDDENLSPDPLFPDEKTFKSTILVEVVDNSGTPLSDAEVRIGSLQAKTNSEGIVYWKDARVVSSTYIIVKRDGYFHGSRRIYPVEAQSAHVRIMLLEYKLREIFNTQGNQSVLTGDIGFTFSPNSIVRENGEDYHGDVSLYYQVLSADDPNLAFKMPGNLSGKNMEGGIGLLKTYGMFAAELRAPDGGLLQIKPGMPARVQLAVPPQMLNSAPPSIPLWYFDEDNGIWIEEGIAELSGSNYIGDVTHFSWWNCDIWFDAVRWSTTVYLANGDPAAAVQVCLHIPTRNAITCALTNPLGVGIGYTIKDEPLDMKITNACYQVIYADQLEPISTPTVFPSITLPPQNDIQVISGTAVDCNNNPVTNGYASLRYDNYRYYGEIQNANGEFNFSVANCDESAARLTVFDNQNNTRSEVQEHTFAEIIDAGQVSVCLVNEEFIKLHVPDINQTFSFLDPEVYFNQATSIYSNGVTDSLSYFSFSFDSYEPGTYQIEDPQIKILLPDGSSGYASNVEAVITHFGQQGDYVRGNLDGLMNIEPPSVFAGIYPFQAEFIVLLH